MRVTVMFILESKWIFDSNSEKILRGIPQILHSQELRQTEKAENEMPQATANAGVWAR